MARHKRNHADPVFVDPNAKWSAIDVPALWEAELAPLLINDAKLQRSLERAVHHYRKECLFNATPRWKFAPDTYPPFLFTRSEGAEMWVQDRISAAAEAGDPDALAHDCLMHVLFSEADLDLKAATIADLQKKIDQIEQKFWPRLEQDHIWARPFGSCHWIVNFTRDLAAAWRPDLDWLVLEGEHHSTVISFKEKFVFDLLIHKEEGDTPQDAEAVWFALNDPRSTSRKASIEVEALNKSLEAARRVGITPEQFGAEMRQQIIQQSEIDGTCPQESLEIAAHVINTAIQQL